jgi:diadenosine tetraphosphate (Ap4A) HIT family hydrolase
MNDSLANDCLFCRLPGERLVDENALALVVRDAFPVSPGHSLVIVRRHVTSFFELTADELTAIHELLWRAKDTLDSSLKPDGYNIGVNDGKTAGQTIMHVHIHLIPRFTGDVIDPTGGIRNVILGKGSYRTTPCPPEPRRDGGPDR